MLPLLHSASWDGIWHKESNNWSIMALTMFPGVLDVSVPATEDEAVPFVQ